VTGKSGVTRSIRQPGFGVTIPADGSDPSEPFRLTDQQLASLRSLLENPTDKQQGALPIEPLSPVQKFGSKDAFKPDKTIDDQTGQDVLLQGSAPAGSAADNPLSGGSGNYTVLH
jgi:hypothetical protein